MENLHTFLQRNNITVNSSESDSDTSIDGGFRTLDSNSSAPMAVYKAEGGSVSRANRLPTRKPDPNVYNRNAVLARENRKKKKFYLMAIEKQLEEISSANTVLKRALKKQVKISRRLEQEKKYFKNILENRTEIFSLISALNLHLSQPPQGHVNAVLQSPAYHSSESSVGSVNFETSDNGTVVSPKNFLLPDKTSSNFIDDFFTDFDLKTDIDSTWTKLLGDEKFCFEGQHNSESDKNLTSHNIADEHSYVNLQGSRAAPDEVHTTDDSGVCLHIARGKLSLELCASCQWNACEKLPTQLLQEEFDISKWRSDYSSFAMSVILAYLFTLLDCCYYGKVFEGKYFQKVSKP